jgi:hypothetical protein
VDPIGSYSDPYFYTDSSSGAMTFKVPSGAGTTANSHYPRSEMRDRGTFRMGGTHTLSASMKVLQQPATGQIIIGQIHGEQTGGSELLKLRWTNGDILMGVKTTFGATEQKILVKSGVAIGQNIDWTIKLVGQRGDGDGQRHLASYTYDQASWAASTCTSSSGRTRRTTSRTAPGPRSRSRRCTRPAQRTSRGRTGWRW